jgi:hypothetical protein
MKRPGLELCKKPKISALLNEKIVEYRTGQGFSERCERQHVTFLEAISSASLVGEPRENRQQEWRSDLLPVVIM